MKTGDIVRLQSGGPLMTVVLVTEGVVTCMWFDERNPEPLQKDFPPETLKSSMKADEAKWWRLVGTTEPVYLLPEQVPPGARGPYETKEAAAPCVDTQILCCLGKSDSMSMSELLTRISEDSRAIQQGLNELRNDGEVENFHIRGASELRWMLTEKGVQTFQRYKKL